MRMQPSSRQFAVSALVVSLIALVGLGACGRTELDTYARQDQDSSGVTSFDEGETSGSNDAASGDDAGLSATGLSETGAGTDATGGVCEPYADPALGCCEGETELILLGIEGSYCAPGCSVDEDCPAAPEGTPLTTSCTFAAEPGGPKAYCAIVCMADSGTNNCPAGASCAPTGSGSWGVCTFS